MYILPQTNIREIVKQPQWPSLKKLEANLKINAEIRHYKNYLDVWKWFTELLEINHTAIEI